MTKYIFVTGGVISGVGKGVTTASIGKIMQEYGFSVTAIKIDPYINFDAGTLRPTEHGEVWVTDDGGEIDQDLGNYERFLNQSIPKNHNLTTGQIYHTVIERERSGQYLGKTVQYIPHITDEIKKRITTAAQGYDIALVEIGGTTGDYENIPYLFSAKSLEKEIGKNNVLYFLVTYLPVPHHAQEMKTKPTQQAIKMLYESAGIFPDFIICRSRFPIDEVRKKKIETYVNISSEYIISAPDSDSIYKIPTILEKEKLGKKIIQKFKLKPKRHPRWQIWDKLIRQLQNPKKKLKIAIVGKYLNIGQFTLEDSYISIREALNHASAHLHTQIEIIWIDASHFEKHPKKISELNFVDGIIIPGGFGDSGVEGKIAAIRYAREHQIPFLGLCYGMQLAIIEFARHVCHLPQANTTEVNPKTPDPVIDILPAQKKILNQNRYGATMRLGAYLATLDPKSKIYHFYQKTKRLTQDQKQIKYTINEKSGLFRLGLNYQLENSILERHRHRYEVSPQYLELLSKKGISFSGWHIRTDHTKLIEFIELPNHPFFLATQAHPEFKSSLINPAPLFLGFIQACLK